MALCCLIMVATILICIFNTKERVSGDEAVEDIKKEKPDLKSLLEALKIMLKNKYWLIMIITQIFHFISVQLTMTVGAYYALYKLGNMSHLSWLLSTMVAPSIVIQFLTPALVKKVGKLKIFYTGAALSAAGGIGFGLAAPMIPVMILRSFPEQIFISITSMFCVRFALCSINRMGGENVAGEFSRGIKRLSLAKQPPVKKLCSKLIF